MEDDDEELYSLDPTIPMKTSKQKLKTALARIDVLENDIAILTARLQMYERTSQQIRWVANPDPKVVAEMTEIKDDALPARWK